MAEQATTPVGTVDRAGRCTSCGTRLWAEQMSPIVLDFSVVGADEDACLTAAIEYVKQALGGNYAVDMGAFKSMRMKPVQRVIRPDNQGMVPSGWEMDCVYVDHRRRS